MTSAAVVEGSAVVVSRSVAELLGRGVVESGSAVIIGHDADNPTAGWSAAWLFVEQTAVHGGAGRRCALVAAETGQVVAAGPITEVQLAGDPIPTLDVMPAWVGAVAEAAWDTAQARRERDTTRAALLAHERRLEVIVNAAHEWADEHSLCEKFDQFMIDNDLRPRLRDWECVVDVTVRVRIPVSSHSSDAAEETVDRALVEEAVCRLSGRELADAVTDHDLVDTEAA